MAMLTIRNLDEGLKRKLKILAARQGVSMEEQARRILREALAPKSGRRGLGNRIHRRFAELGGVEVGIPERSPARTAPGLSEP